MSNPIGTWKLNANGYEGQMVVKGVSSKGELDGASIFGEKITGFWDDASQTINFIRQSKLGDPSTIQVYTGYMIPNAHVPGKLEIDGYFEGFKGTGASAQRNVYGWQAYQAISVTPPK